MQDEEIGRSAMSEQREEFGVCDECGDYTEELMLVDGSWICRVCSRVV